VENKFVLFPRCMECQRGPAMRKVSVHLSVCLFICQMRELRQNGRKICQYFYTVRKIKMAGGGRTLLHEILGPPALRSEIANFEPIFAHSTSAVTPSEKGSINTNRKYTKCFPM